MLCECVCLGVVVRCCRVVRVMVYVVLCCVAYCWLCARDILDIVVKCGVALRVMCVCLTVRCDLLIHVCFLFQVSC